CRQEFSNLVRRATAQAQPRRGWRVRLLTAPPSPGCGGRVGSSVDARVFVKDATDLLDRRRGGLGRMTRAYDQLRFNAVDVRALVFDHSIVALLYRFTGMIECACTPGAIGVSDGVLMKGCDGSMLSRAVGITSGAPITVDLCEPCGSLGKSAGKVD